MSSEERVKDVEEEELECLVFGTKPVFFEADNVETSVHLKRVKPSNVSTNDHCTFIIDRSGEDDEKSANKDRDVCDDSTQGSGSEVDASPDSASADQPPSTKAAWFDEDDELVTVGEAAAALTGDRNYRPSIPAITNYRSTLQQRFTNVYGQPQWAELPSKKRARKRQRSEDSAGDSDTGDEEEQRVLATSGTLLSKSSEYVPRGSIDYKRCGDLSSSCGRLSRSVTALQFHPRAQVAVVGGGAGRSLSIVQVDGDKNPLIQQIVLPDSSGGGAGRNEGARWARFSSDGSWLFSGSPLSSQLYCYDMMSGAEKQVSFSRRLQLRSLPQLLVSPDGRLLALLAARAGCIHLLSSSSQEVIGTFQLGCRPVAASFAPDGGRLWVHTEHGGAGGGDSGHVFEWDIHSRQCVHRFTDEGCLSGSAVAASGDGLHLACGSTSGIVNLYSTADVRRSQSPRPLKVLPQLTTACTGLMFNSSGEILAMSSAEKENAVRLVHVRSRTVFSNFPGWTKGIRRPYIVEFSQNSGYMTIGTSNSYALLYRLKHYPNF